MYTNYCMTITNCKQNGTIFGSFVHNLADVYYPWKEGVLLNHCKSKRYPYKFPKHSLRSELPPLRTTNLGSMYTDNADSSAR